MTCNLTISSSAVKDLAIFLRTSGAILGTCSQYSPMSHRMLARAMGTCGCGGIRTGVNVARGWARCLPGNWPTALRGSLETGVGGGEREIKRRAFSWVASPPFPRVLASSNPKSVMVEKTDFLDLLYPQCFTATLPESSGMSCLNVSVWQKTQDLSISHRLGFGENMSGELSEGSPKGRLILGNAITVTWSHLSPPSTYRPLRANMEGLNLILLSTGFSNHGKEAWVGRGT